MKRGGVKVRAVGPNKCMHFRIDPDLFEYLNISQGTESLPQKNWSEVDKLLGLIVERDTERVGRFDGE